MEKPSVLLQNNHCLIYIDNIPKDYHAKHLRNFFSVFVENGWFSYFHYQHRPSIFKKKDPITKKRTYCAYIILKETLQNNIITNYHNIHWLDFSNKDEPLSSLCILKNISPNVLIKPKDSKSQSKNDLLDKCENHGIINCENEIDTMPEFNPPKCMPQGNVGTPTKYFFELVNKCLLPSSVISKLGLSLCQHKKGIYSAVQFNYNEQLHYKRLKKDYYKKQTHVKLLHSDEYDQTYRCGSIQETNNQINISDGEKESESDDEDAEEWDRFEAFHDDPHDTNHSKEKTYEEEMEVTWEKGGPGLVWYTDNSFWKDLESTRKDDFFNDPTNYDLDIDMQNYYHESAPGDRDCQDLQAMHRSQTNATQHIHDPQDFFKTHSASAAHRLMTKLGWKVGQSLGRRGNKDGIRAALDNSGQHPYNKSGLGYIGEKLTSRAVAREASARAMPAWQRRRLQAKLRSKLNEEPVGDIYIGSVFDRSDNRGVPLEEVEDSALRRVESGLAMKYYRDPVRFVPSHVLFKK